MKERATRMRAPGMCAAAVCTIALSIWASACGPADDPISPKRSLSGAGWDSGVEDSGVTDNSIWEDSSYKYEPLVCTAPARDEYKVAHGIVEDLEAEEGGPGGDWGDWTDEQLEGMRHTVLFVFDKSGSMGGIWEEGSKWDVAAEVMVESVAAYQHYLSAGAIFFSTDGHCSVAPIDSGWQIEFQRGSGYLDDWEASIDFYRPSGNTPLLEALQAAHAALVSACDQGVLERPFKVALLTDGEPNCAYDHDLALAYVQEWNEHGIETHVIGLPGSSYAENLLEDIAEEGGSVALMLDGGVDGGVDDFGDGMGAVCE